MPEPSEPSDLRGSAIEVVHHPLVDVLARIGLVAYGLVHLLIAVLAVRIALGAGGQADKTGALQAAAATGWGRVLLWLVVGGLVALVRLGIVVVAGYAAYRGISGAFRRDLDLRGAGLRRSLLVLRLGRVGWTALGTAYVLSGGLLVLAAVRHDPAQPVGLDAALKGLAGHAAGPAVLILLAAGLVVFAVYTLFHARHRAA
jgi:hypothetical protein